MSVTHRKEDPLKLYVDFLNVDLSYDPRPKLKKGQKLKDFLDQWELASLPDTFKLSTGEPVPKPNSRHWLEEAKDLQGEMRNDLFPIAIGKGILEKLFPVHERWVYLAEKLNEMGFMRRWDTHPSKNKKGRFVIRAWNFKPAHTERENWYLGLAERIEEGDIERLRLCPVCNKYFSARDERERFCSKSCKRENDNKDSKVRQKRFRERQKTKAVEKKPENRLREQKAKRLSETVSLIISQPKDLKTVGPIVKKLGGGDSIEGWRLIRGWENDFKNGKSPEQVLKGLSQRLKDCF